MACIGAVKLAATATCTSAAQAAWAVSASRSAVSDWMKRADTVKFPVDRDGGLLSYKLFLVHPRQHHADRPLGVVGQRQAVFAAVDEIEVEAGALQHRRQARRHVVVAAQGEMQPGPAAAQAIQRGVVEEPEFRRGISDVAKGFARDHASSSSSSSANLVRLLASTPRIFASHGGGASRIDCRRAMTSRAGPVCGYFIGCTPARTILAAAGPPTDCT